MAARFYAPKDCKMKPSKPGAEHEDAEGRKWTSKHGPVGPNRETRSLGGMRRTEL